MAYRPVDPRSFLDDIAGVDDGEESQSSSDELDFWDRDNGEAETPSSSRTRYREVDNADATSSDFGERAEELAARFRERERLARSRARNVLAVSTQEQPYTAGPSNLSGFHPTDKDAGVFGLFCKKGVEEILVLQFTRKILDVENNEGAYRDIRAVFYVPISPGRIYFEASRALAVETVAATMLDVYYKSIFVVSLEDRVALLAGRSSSRLFEVGERVRIRNGVYEGDIGIVHSIIGAHDEIVVKVKSRNKHHALTVVERTVPDELGNDGASRSSDTTTRKRKRANTKRLEPYLLPRHPHKAELLDGQRVAVNEDGFKFSGEMYTNDGYLLLHYRCDRLKRISGGTCESSSLADAQASEVLDGLSVLSTPSFFNVGDHVLVSKGSGVGSIGTINKLSLDIALIVLDEDGESRAPGLQPVSTEAPLSDLTRLFELGELVEVQSGVHKGRSGQVAEFDVDKQFMRIADLRKNEVIEVSSKDVDTVQSKDAERQVLVRSERRRDVTSLELGCNVVIQKGRHEGKQGTVSCLKRNVVIVSEDVTGCQFIVSREFVKPLSVKQQVPHSLEVWRRDAFKALAISIGMELDLFSVMRDGEEYVSSRINKFPPDYKEPVPHTLMHDRHKRIQIFWNFVKIHGIRTSDMIEVARYKAASGQEPEGQVQKPFEDDVYAFWSFADDVFIDLNNEASRDLRESHGKDLIETPAQEQQRWECCFTELARRLKITIKYVGLPLDYEDVSQTHVCTIEHEREGFEGQEVYIWGGLYKGRFGRVKQMNGTRCKLQLESVVFGVNTIVVDSDHLIAKCGCTLGNGRRRPKWSFDLKSVISLFDRTLKVDDPRARTPELERDTTPEAEFHDPASHGMWLFHPRIAELRKTHAFHVKIDSHPDSEVSGRREGKVLSDPNGPMHPLPMSFSPNVMVRYEIKKKDEVRMELLPVHTLSAAGPKPKRRHAVISGDQIGDVVVYVRSAGDNSAQILEAGSTEITYIAKSEICLLDECT